MYDSFEVGAVDPVTVIIKECITLSTAMRKDPRNDSQLGVAAILGGGSEIFSNDDDYLASTFNNLSINHHDSPLLSNFIQLRLKLNKLQTLDGIDSLAILKPFLNVISDSSVPGYITSIALDSLQKFYSLEIINNNSTNHILAYRGTVNALAHCRFEGSSAMFDDSVLLKVIILLHSIVNSPTGDLLSDSILYEVLQILMSLSFNKERTDVLRKAAETSLISMTSRIFRKLNSIKPALSKHKYINDESYITSDLKDDIIGSRSRGLKNSKPLNHPNSHEYEELPTNTNNGLSNATMNTSSDKNTIQATSTHDTMEQDSGDDSDIEGRDTHESSKSNLASINSSQQDLQEDVLEENYGLPLINKYMNLLLSLIAPENHTKHTSSTKIIALKLIDVAVQVSGKRFLLHPRLFNLISDPIFKSVLYIIQTSFYMDLLQSTLQLFSTLVVILGDQLHKQIELTLNTIFEILLDEKPDIYKNKKANNNSRSSINLNSARKSVSELDLLHSKEKFSNTNRAKRTPKIKELFIEQISILWTRSKSFFTRAFINYDCTLDRSDISIKFLHILTELALPESAMITSENVPPMCLEGLISLIDDMYANLIDLDNEKFKKMKIDEVTDILKQRERKKKFIECTSAFNAKWKVGISKLIENKFIESDKNEDISRFLFENNERLNKKMIGLVLCDPNNTELLEKFNDLFDFRSLRVDEAIRVLLTKFRLPGESQQIERIIEAFSKKFSKDVECVTTDDESNISDNQCLSPNKKQNSKREKVVPDQDSVFVLSYSIIMLNTDLHNPQVKEHMTFDEYSSNLKGCYNGNSDFPVWYLQRIYSSIEDKEIVMPEEHHGNEKWFEDAWNNLISSTTVITELNNESTRIDLNRLNRFQIALFDKVIFENNGKAIVDTLIKIYDIASDDHISSRMISTLDKCCIIASFFGYNDIFNYIVQYIAECSDIVDSRNSQRNRNSSESKNDDKLSNRENNAVHHNSYTNYEPVNTRIPVMEINVESNNSIIAVSSTSVKLGMRFKNQLCLVMLFRILSTNKIGNILSDDSWTKIIDIILTLYENLLLKDDRIGIIVKPELVVNKAKVNRGILSTFASYLKGDEEPNDEQIGYSLKGIDCINKCSILDATTKNRTYINKENIEKILTCIDDSWEVTHTNKRYLESEILYLFQLVIDMNDHLQNQEESCNILKKIKLFTDKNSVSEEFKRECNSYTLRLLTGVNNDTALERVGEIIMDINTKNEIYTAEYFKSRSGVSFIQEGLLMIDFDIINNNELYWKILRQIVIIGTEHMDMIYKFLYNVLETNSTKICSSTNFMSVLGIMDEISSIGAIGSQWEQTYANLITSGHKVNQENPYQDKIDISNHCVELTYSILLKNVTMSKNEIIGIIQALAHQCLNPCNQINNKALILLEKSIKIEIDRMEIQQDGMKMIELIDGGLMPLLMEQYNEYTVNILNILKNVYLYYQKLSETSTTDQENVFIKVMSIFNKFTAKPPAEKVLQEMLEAKKMISAERVQPESG
ncbi:hypothetical protein TBLA_0C01600 [Henningerozyma blattae CBS 6284]|uniref:SEC7 domain-containing protein n=1 Tax=Henningerozyma blattae (strain ATCC 34711 / CBS 6284 / DSM 70876 / NBRC 10599 / NRRL Y-10934 / UCD 77-7) TaxID=1071380 RepID=I2H0S2_HENB6|nr:hypothetical protein TBLA_0C01600 [Tetrapisispora blattae CBS 6284]CCH59974.1 hypothetical protein TBLA_0C01600 [Tetrapisispora blattae CBS 6284]